MKTFSQLNFNPSFSDGILWVHGWLVVARVGALVRRYLIQLDEDDGEF